MSIKVTLSGIFVLSLALFGLQACGPKNTEHQPDCGFVQNVYGERISWKTSEAVTLLIDKNFPAEFRPALEAAIQRWERVAGRPLFRIGGELNESNKNIAQDGVNGIYWMSEWESSRSDEQARTSVYWVVDQIKEVDIRVNAKDFTYYEGAPNSSRDIHLESLFVHELGHALGLRHEDAVPSVMATRLSQLTVRTDLSDSDTSALSCEYM